MAEKEKKVKNSENAIQRYFRETIGELRKVNLAYMAGSQTPDRTRFVGDADGGHFPGRRGLSLWRY